MKTKMEIQKAFILRLQELMKDKSINQSELARQTKIPHQTVSSWLNGTRTIQIDSLNLLADYFCVSTDYLLGRED